MSVINNVLKDLENRESRFTPIELAPLSASPAAARARVRPLLWILPLLCLGLAGGWIYLQRPMPAFEAAAPLPVEAEPPAAPAAAALQPAPRQSEETQARDPNPQPAVPAASQDGAPPAAATAAAGAPAALAAGETGNQIIGLQLRESVDEMQMTFLLRARAVAYLKERGQDHFSYHLRAVDSQIAAPRMRDNRWLRRLEIGAAGSGVDIEFSTAPGILVETRQGLLDGEPTWSISLRRPPPASAREPSAGGLAAAAPQAAPGTVAADTDAVDTDAVDTDAIAAGAAAPPENGPAPGAETPLEIPAPAPPAAEPAPVRLDIRTADAGAKSIDRLGRALDLIKARRAAEAEAMLRELLGGPDDYAARQRLLALYQRERQPRRFEQLLTESLRRYPGDVPLQTEYARLLVGGGAYREAIELLAPQADLDANRLALVAASYQRLGRHPDAVRHYRLALAQNPADARNWIALGISLEQGAAHADALQSYQRAAALGGLDAELQSFVEQRSAALKRALD